MFVTLFSILICYSRKVKSLLVKIPTENNLLKPNYGPKESDWLICPPPLKSYWLKPQYQKTLLVEIPTGNNLPAL
jgi:hypothetical protein